MTRNVGNTEGRVRGAAGSALLAAAFTPRRSGTWGALVGGVGVVLLATAIARYCPLNELFGRKA